MKTWKRTGVALFAGGLLLGAAGVQAGGKIAIDETKWISIGAGARGSFQTIEDQAPNGSDWSDDFNLDNARLYLNGQIHSSSIPSAYSAATARSRNGWSSTLSPNSKSLRC